MDRMDRIVAAAVRQGFTVWQTDAASWMFRKGGLLLVAAETPQTTREWLLLLGALRGAGLEIGSDL